MEDENQLWPKVLKLTSLFGLKKVCIRLFCFFSFFVVGVGGVGGEWSTKGGQGLRSKQMEGILLLR